jgi:hypothetical protein
VQNLEAWQGLSVDRPLIVGVAYRPGSGHDSRFAKALEAGPFGVMLGHIKRRQPCAAHTCFCASTCDLPRLKRASNAEVFEVIQFARSAA